MDDGHFDRMIDQLFEEKTVGNIAVRVGVNNTILLDYYKSNTDTLNENTLFDAASITKVTATLMLTLIAMEKGLLSLNDSVADYFPCPDNRKSTTIFHLLTHTMGIGHKALNIKGNDYNNIQDYILRIPIDIPVGEEVIYSCPGFILLGKTVEKVFSERLDVLFKKYVTVPLSMNRTSFLPDRTEQIVNNNIADEDVGIVNDYNARFLGGIAGNAGVFSCVSDLTKFVHMLLRQGSPLIKAETLQMACRNYTPTMSESRGLGFVYVDERYFQTGKLFAPGSIGHPGHTGQSFFVNLQTGLYVILLSDATIAGVKKYGIDKYDEVKAFREKVHNAILHDVMNDNAMGKGWEE